MKKALLLCVLCSFVLSSCAQMPIDKVFETKALGSLEQFKEMLALSNDAHFPKDIEKNIVWTETHFAKRGFTTQRLETFTVPLLLAEKKSDNKKAKTVLVYVQMDGQPVDPNHWFQDNPYTATLKQEGKEGGWETIDWSDLKNKPVNKDWRIFARSTSDAKGPVNAFLTAMDMLNEKNLSPNFNLKVIIDFEEELGSPQLPKAVTKYKKNLDADRLIIFDGPMHLSNEPTLTFGARGIATITLTVFGPTFPQHSGHYGNYVPNPAMRLSQLLASMKDDNGKVTIPTFYEGIQITDDVKAILDAVPDNEAVINAKLGIGSSDKVAPTYQESLQYPSLNVRGMLSGWVGEESRTIIPASATAEIDIRLVLESEPKRLIELVRKHVEEQGYYLTTKRPTSRERLEQKRICQFSYEISYQAFRTDFKSDVGLWLDKALTKAHGRTPIKQRTFGGSIPISPFVTQLNIPAVIVPTVNRDNNQHSPNENIRIGNYIDAVKTIYAILTEPIK